MHGAAIVGQYIKESFIINRSFVCRYINLGTSTTLDEIGKCGKNKIHRYLFILIQVIRQLIIFRPALCYMTITAKGRALYKDAIVAFLVKLFNIQLIYHLHNKGVLSRQEYFWDNLLYRAVFNNAVVILLSKYLYSDVQKYVPKNRVHYCPYGIPNSVENTSVKDQKTSDKNTEILFLSNLIESKGVFVLLEACKILKEKHLPFHCTFVGGEGDVTKEKFQNIVRQLDLGSHVHYVGGKYGQDKEKVFFQSDIFVFPTYYDYETFGLVNLEAMKFALPVISTFEGGIPDIVDDGVTGFLVPQRDVKMLAERIETLIADPDLRRKMGIAGYEKFKKQFSLDAFENCMKQILDRTILEK